MLYLGAEECAGDRKFLIRYMHDFGTQTALPGNPGVDRE